MAALLALTQAPFEGSPITLLLVYGPLGLMVVLFLSGYLYPRPMIDWMKRENERLVKDNEKLREENRTLRSGIEERVVPALLQTGEAVQRTNDLMDKMASRTGT